MVGGDLTVGQHRKMIKFAKLVYSELPDVYQQMMDNGDLIVSFNRELQPYCTFSPSTRAMMPDFVVERILVDVGTVINQNYVK